MRGMPNTSRPVILAPTLPSEWRSTIWRNGLEASLTQYGLEQCTDLVYSARCEGDLDIGELSKHDTAVTNDAGA